MLKNSQLFLLLFTILIGFESIQAQIEGETNGEVYLEVLKRKQIPFKSRVFELKHLLLGAPRFYFRQADSNTKFQGIGFLGKNIKPFLQADSLALPYFKRYQRASVGKGISTVGVVAGTTGIIAGLFATLLRADNANEILYTSAVSTAAFGGLIILFSDIESKAMNHAMATYNGNIYRRSQNLPPIKIELNLLNPKTLGLTCSLQL
ncbi:MAG: hypothetical protein AB8B69_02450 [Chitinophagales bacterium]